MRLIGLASIAFALTLTLTSASARQQTHSPLDGRSIFRFDTFGDEQLWTDVLRMHEAIQTVSPATALGVGLKVDVNALPPEIVGALKAGDVDLDDPAITRALLRLNAVVGVIGKVDESDQITSIGITCALCHSTVDDSFTAGVGNRLDGWPNSDLNVGAIVGLSPSLDPALKTEFSLWGPGIEQPVGAGCHSTGLRTQRRRLRDLYRRRSDLLLEQLCRRVANGWPRQLPGCAPRSSSSNLRMS
jgi:hypothetical protein